jgi:peptidoglycan/LPS O-acetylase OafA/YrhL
MDDRWPQLIGLLLAGALVLLNLRHQLGDERGQRLFRLLMLVFLTVIAVAVFLLLREGGEAPPIPPDADGSTVAALESSPPGHVALASKRL